MYTTWYLFFSRLKGNDSDGKPHVWGCVLIDSEGKKKKLFSQFYDTDLCDYDLVKIIVPLRLTMRLPDLSPAQKENDFVRKNMLDLLKIHCCDRHNCFKDSQH